ncbi:MAG TPA: LuxR family transcriptional regulator [Xanthobacteraceae bacterium]|nr:LuxR family transcriptional regulator [Xanthobacteraceae bacterium]
MRAAIGLECAARCAAGDDLPALIADFQETIRTFGFAASSCGAWIGLGHARTHRFFFRNWPPDWIALYESGRMFARDPIVSEARRRMVPFLWEEISRLSEDEAQVLATVRAHGWIDGFVVPIHGPAGYHGVVSLAATAPLRLDPLDRAVVTTMATTIHHRCRSAIGFGSTSHAPARLTAREIECLQLVASGKTDWEIGALLGIAAVTAHYHVEYAKTKLGVRSRVQAVALLILHGML